MTYWWLIMTFKWLMNDLFKMKWLINSFKLKLFLLHNIDIDYVRPQLPAWKEGLFQVWSFWDMIMSLEARQPTFKFWECSAVRRNYDTSLINGVNFTLDWWKRKIWEVWWENKTRTVTQSLKCLLIKCCWLYHHIWLFGIVSCHSAPIGV